MTDDTPTLEKALEIAYSLIPDDQAIVWADGTWILWAAIFLWSPEVKEEILGKPRISPAMISNKQLGKFADQLHLVTGHRYTYRYLRQILTGYRNMTDNLYEVLSAFLVCGGAVSLANRIRTLRLLAHLTQEELGAVSDLSNTYLCDIEKGRIEPPLRTIRKIAAGLEIPISVLLDGIE